MIDQETLKELFDYNPETGDFIRKRSQGKRAKAGDIAGFNARGHTYVSIAGKAYPAKNLVWLFHHGKMPESVLNNINGIKTDNRIENLAPKDEEEFTRPVIYESAAFLKNLSNELDLLNMALIRHELDDQTRVRVMRSFANLHRLPSRAEQHNDSTRNEE